MDGIIFSIEEFSIYDGPGIRTTVFLKGCPLHCSWCHNPEGQATEFEISKSPNGCIECGSCDKFADRSNNTIAYTQKSIEMCPHNLLRVIGEKVNPNEIYSRIMKNEKILKNGGVTFSGGEPLMQNEFLSECLELFGGKVHTAIQTSGFCDNDIFKRILSLTDLCLFDLKLIDREEHIKFTGVSNESILNNFNTLSKSGKDFVIRIPIIPHITDSEKNITAIAKLLKERSISYAELLPYNNMAGGKYKMLGRKYSPLFDENSKSNPHKEIFDLYGIDIKIL